MITAGDVMNLSLLEKQTDRDFALLRKKLLAVEENIQAIRVLMDRIEIPIKHHLMSE